MQKITGVVVSAKTPQTAIVEVVRRWQHPLYHKFIKKNRHFACHYVDLTIKEGDTVAIEPCRPISKTKRFKVVEKVKEIA
jgi:small subunit ribosomal protein S17